MSSVIRHVTTGIVDDCIRCGRPIEFSERDHTFAWRHIAEDASHDPTPEQLSLRTVTDRFLSEQRDAVRRDHEERFGLQ